MLNIPAITRKKRKASYKKPEAVKLLEALADVEARLKHPDMPNLCPRTFRDDTANSLTACIVKYVTLKGGFASRISNQGTFNRRLNKYIPGTSRRGLADVMATYKGKSIHCEVKIGRDEQSEVQKKIEFEVIRSGGYYYLAHDFESFKTYFDNLK